MNTMTTNACKEMSQIAVLNGMTAIRANVIAQRTDSTLCGMTKAMMIEILKTKLREGVAHFVFVKKDGSLRECYATTKKELVSTQINGRGVSRENYATTAVWDCIKGAWISFRWETILKVY